MYVIQLPPEVEVKYVSPWAKRVFSASSFFIAEEPFVVVFQINSEICVVKSMKFDRSLCLMSSIEEARRIDPNIPQLDVHF